MTKSRPTGTGGYLTNENSQRFDLPRGYDPAARGYLRLRARASGPLTNRELRAAFGGNSVTNELLKFYLDFLQSSELIEYRAIKRGLRYWSYEITLLNHEVARDYIKLQEELSDQNPVTQVLQHFGHRQHRYTGFEFIPSGKDAQNARRVLAMAKGNVARVCSVIDEFWNSGPQRVDFSHFVFSLGSLLAERYQERIHPDKEIKWTADDRARWEEKERRRAEERVREREQEELDAHVAAEFRSMVGYTPRWPRPRARRTDWWRMRYRDGNVLTAEYEPVWSLEEIEIVGVPADFDDDDHRPDAAVLPKVAEWLRGRSGRLIFEHEVPDELMAFIRRDEPFVGQVEVSKGTLQFTARFSGKPYHAFERDRVRAKRSLWHLPFDIMDDASGTWWKPMVCDGWEVQRCAIAAGGLDAWLETLGRPAPRRERTEKPGRRLRSTYSF